MNLIEFKTNQTDRLYLTDMCCKELLEAVLPELSSPEQHTTFQVRLLLNNSDLDTKSDAENDAIWMSVQRVNVKDAEGNDVLNPNGSNVTETIRKYWYNSEQSTLVNMTDVEQVEKVYTGINKDFM